MNKRQAATACLLLALAMSLMFSGAQAQLTTLFSDDFESGAKVGWITTPEDIWANISYAGTHSAHINGDDGELHWDANTAGLTANYSRWQISFYWQSDLTNTPILYYHDSDSGMQFELVDGELRAMNVEGTVDFGFQINTWYHFTLTSDGEFLTLRIDDVAYYDGPMMWLMSGDYSSTAQFYGYFDSAWLDNFQVYEGNPPPTPVPTASPSDLQGWAYTGAALMIGIIFIGIIAWMAFTLKKSVRGSK